MGRVSGFDHVVLTVEDIERSLRFYREVLGFEVLREAEWRRGEVAFPSLKVGERGMINVHGPEYKGTLVARDPRPGTADLCFVWDGTPQEALDRLKAHRVAVEMGPVRRRGERGQEGTSVYFRDPDGNLLELLAYE